MAVGAEPLVDSRYLHAVIDLAVRGLPHAYRDVPAATGETVVIEVTGQAGGLWTLWREEERWRLSAGAPVQETTRVRIDDDSAWKLLFNALPQSAAAAAVTVIGRAALAEPIFGARSVIV